MRLPNITNHSVYKVSKQKRPNIETLIREHRFDLIINIPSPEGNGQTKTDGETIRELTVAQNIPLVTDIEVARHMSEKIKNHEHGM
ncbi:MAG: hypothetical protein HYV41_04455 [Candidatus Magasanikbacteria bacterium]|nr:hypothetical protein [Candidatus Magasanikbacteria bacterium]